VHGDGRAAGPGADRDSVYAGIGGLAPVLAEIAQYRPLTGAEQALAAGIVARLGAGVPARAEPSLYDGLAGDVMALRLLARGREQAALARLAELMTDRGWNTTLEVVPGSTAPVTDLIQGGAGVVLAAVWAGGEHAGGISTTGGLALLNAADPAKGGLDWAMVPGMPSRAPNYSHGTAGVATALAIAGAALGRADFVAAAVQGAQHLLAVGSLDQDGFTVPPHPAVLHTGRRAGDLRLVPRASRHLAPVRRAGPGRGGRGRRAGGEVAAATMPGRRPRLRGATAAPAGFLGQRWPLLRHRGRGGRAAGRRAGLRR
jgi:hypothetical protein